MITIVGAILLYFAVAVVAVGAVGADALGSTAAPLRVAAAHSPYPWLAVVVSVGGLTAMLGVILSQVLGLSRMAFAMARRGDLPRLLEHIHPGSAVPDRAVLLAGGIAALVAATGTLRGVAAAASFTILVYYAITNLAALRMPQKAKLYPGVVPWVGLLACVLLALSLAAETMAVGVGVLAVGIGARWLARRHGAARGS